MLCADKAYLSRKICDLIAKCGGEPFISIKKKNIVKVRSKGRDQKLGRRCSSFSTGVARNCI
jgi:hypothetical protein